jgi:hypothetical protein
MAANYRGLLGIDRGKDTSSVRKAERLKLNAVADHAWAFADRSELHLLQDRHGNGSCCAVGRASARSVVAQVPNRLPMDLRSERPGP